MEQLEKEPYNAMAIHSSFAQQVKAAAALCERKMNQWVDVEDKLPESGEYVLCKFRVVWLDQKYVVNFWSADTDQDEHWFKKVFTHWQPLPEPPKDLTEHAS